MKKILLCGVAALAVAAASPAKAEGIDLGLGGSFIGYGLYVDTDNDSDQRNFDFRKETEVHVNGETTLDNGLTVGAHVELDVDAEDTNTIEESYMYLSGGWGRVNFGQEDGATYLLQVAAPSADDNIDGIDADINGFNLSTLSGVAFTSDSLTYGSEPTGEATKLTYITPLFNGFQAAASFTPSVTDGDSAGTGFTADNNPGQFDTAYEIAARYQAAFQGVDLTAGAGYATLQTEEDAAVATAIGSDDREVFNVGVRAGFDAFGVGVSYLDDNNGVDTNGDTDILVVGADYVTGPFKFGASYYDRTDEQEAAALTTLNAGDLDITRWTVGTGYQYGPGMSLNGSVAFLQVEDDNFDADGFQVGVGTRVDF